jgi:hypothetical protein
MIDNRFVLLPLAFVGLSIITFSTQAFQQNVDIDAEKAIKSYLSSKKSDTEGADSQGSAIADLNGDGKSEIVLVWTLLGPTYWHNTLTILTKTNEGYKPIAAYNLKGEAKLRSVRSGIIYTDEKIYGKNDPICCPSIKKEGKYRWVGKTIREIK